MTIWCKHVHRLELQKFFNLSVAHSPVRLDIDTKFPYFLFLTWLSIIRNRRFRLYISSLTGECAAQKLKNLCSSSLWTCLHHMVILKSQNKITDFFMILAWASPFKPTFGECAVLAGKLLLSICWRSNVPRAPREHNLLCLNTKPTCEKWWIISS